MTVTESEFVRSELWGLVAPGRTSSAAGAASWQGYDFRCTSNPPRATVTPRDSRLSYSGSSGSMNAHDTLVARLRDLQTASRNALEKNASVESLRECVRRDIAEEKEERRREEGV